MQFDIKAVDVEWTGTGAKKYGKATVTYFAGGQPRQHKVMSFVNPEVFKKVQELSGQTVEVEVVKNDKGFNEWKSITALSAGSASSGGSASPAASATTTRVSGSNYETKEERAARQVLIVKQSSLSAAAATLAPGAKAALDPELVIATAQRYADWVFETNDPEDHSGFDNMKEDLPF